MNDALVLDLVKELDGRRELPEAITNRYSYLATLIEYGRKEYRLIWPLEENALDIGVVNAYRDGRRS